MTILKLQLERELAIMSQTISFALIVLYYELHMRVSTTYNKLSIFLLNLGLEMSWAFFSTLQFIIGNKQIAYSNLTTWAHMVACYHTILSINHGYKNSYPTENLSLRKGAQR